MRILLFLIYTEGFVILQRNFTSMSRCSEERGAEIEILIKGLENIGIKQGENYSIECVSSLEEIKNRVLIEDAIGIGGIRPTEELTKSGYYFTHPTFYSGLNILIKKVHMNDNVKLFQVFGQVVWIIMLITPLMIGLLSWVYSIVYNKKTLNFECFLKCMWEAYSASMLSSNATPARTSRLLENILSVYTKLIFLILAAGYASYTYQKLGSFIDKFGDLAGQLVLVEPQYEDLCGQYTLYYYSFSKDFYEQFDDALSLLNDGKYWGIIADHTYLVEQMEKNPDFTINTYPFFSFNYVALYSSSLSLTTAKTINKALAGIENTKYPVKIQEKYGLIHDFKKTTQATVFIKDALWLIIILIAAIVLGVVFSIIPLNGFYNKFWNFCCKRKIHSIDEVEMTNKTEFADFQNKYIDPEKNPDEWSSDLNENFIRLIRVIALSLIEYEDNSLTAIDELIECLKESNKEKIELVKQIKSGIHK